MKKGTPKFPDLSYSLVFAEPCHAVLKTNTYSFLRFDLFTVHVLTPVLTVYMCACNNLLRLVHTGRKPQSFRLNAVYMYTHWNRVHTCTGIDLCKSSFGEMCMTAHQFHLCINSLNVHVVPKN